MIKDITLGQFFPGNSVLHRIDPRMKLILSVLYIVAVFMAQSYAAFVLILLYSFLLVILGRIAVGVVLKGLKPVLFILIFTVLLSVFFTRGVGAEEPIFRFHAIVIYETGIRRAVFMAVRVIALIIGTSVLLTYTTSPIRLTDGIEALFRPLAKLHVPVHDFAMMMSIALRFIPTFVEETDKIMNAQKARGTDFSSGGLIRRAKALLPILIPLIFSAIRRADDLATAMECRCYRGGEGRTKMRELHYAPRDLFMFLFVGAFLAAVILVNRFLPMGSL